jgi:hypothetical protein
LSTGADQRVASEKAVTDSNFLEPVLREFSQESL